MLKACLALYAISLALFSFGQSVYDPKEAFHPQFYPYPGNEYRSAGGEPGPKYWQNRADYKINCSLDTIKHIIAGDLELTYTNNSPDNLKFLWLQLDQNIYRNDSKGSATSGETGGRYSSEGFTDGHVIRKVIGESNGKSYAAKHIIADTRMQVWLQEPVKSSGGKTKLNIQFEFKVPQYGTDRTGRIKTQHGWVYQVAQWFPRVAVYDDIQGWNVLPYAGAGEFYLEYGDVEYSVTVPTSVIVVGSGEQVNVQECFTPDQQKKWNEARNSDKTVLIRSENDIISKTASSKSTQTWRFKMNNTRDIAFGASRAFILDGAKINLPSGKKCLALSAYPVEAMRSKNGDDWRRSTEYVKGSVEHYSAKWYEYPYPAAVNVAGNVSGMEYPGIVFCPIRAAGASLWGVTDHEFGHTWFPMIVGSNERKYAWMDEGFNEFINIMSTEAFNKGEYYAKPDVSSAYGVRSTFGDHVDGLFNMPEVIHENSLATSAYFKPAIMLLVLRESVLGPERFDAALKEYIHRWAFKHPTPWDFFRTMENVGGEDLAWFWRGWVLNTWKIDVAVGEVKYVNSSPANGALIKLENKEKMPTPVTVLVKEANGKEHKINLPVEIWQRDAVWTFAVPTTSEIREVVLDPDRKMPDWNRNNNQWKKAF